MNTNKIESLRSILDDLSDLPDFVGIELGSASQKGNFGNTPLHVVAIRNDISCAKALLKFGADINAIGEAGYTPLHDAVEQNHTEMARFLIASGALLDVKNEDCLTPLELARALNLDEMIAVVKKAKGLV